jgi:hypothetical protein
MTTTTMSVSNRRTIAARAPAASVAVLHHVRILNILVAAGVLALAVGYVFMNSVASTKGFTIKTFEQRIGELQEEQKKLGIEAISGQSMQQIESRIGALGFVPTTHVEYLDPNAGTMAMR